MILSNSFDRSGPFCKSGHILFYKFNKIPGCRRALETVLTLQDKIFSSLQLILNPNNDLLYFS